jgi:hypothetical protein
VAALEEVCVVGRRGPGAEWLTAARIDDKNFVDLERHADIVIVNLFALAYQQLDATIGLDSRSAYAPGRAFACSKSVVQAVPSAAAAV